MSTKKSIKKSKTAKANLQPSRKIVKPSPLSSRFPLGKINYIIIIIGILVLVTGFWTLAQPPLEGWMSKSLAPVLLTLGFIVIIPFGIIWGVWKKDNK